MGKIIGIDLGTTNSCMAFIENGKTFIIPNSEGAKTTRSIVAFTNDGQRLVGESAKRQAVTNPMGTIASIKREMGTHYKKKIGHREYTPQEISAMILQKLKLDAESYLGEPVKQAVITVPAYFNDAQRQATKDAGKIAGLEVLRIINEPTAAALAYGLENSYGQKMMVFDLGGGTFDVSIIEIGNGVIEVLSTSGDNHLGGDDFNEALAQYILTEFEKSSGISLKNDLMAMQRVKEAAEKAKIELSSMISTVVSLPFIITTTLGPQNLEMTITRETFNRITKDLVERTILPMQNALNDARLLPAELNKIILVGGSSRIPAVQDKIKEVTGITPSKSLNPDECVAMGAGIQGGKLSGDITAMGNYDVLNNIKDGNFTDTGNFVLKSGSVTLNALQTIGMGALTVHNDITIEGGVLSTSGQTNGLYSVYNNIFLNNGSIQCLEYSVTGIFARRGDINIAGENTIIVLKGKENRDTVGLSAGDMSHYDSTFFEAGSIKIKEANLSITSDFIGIFAQCLDEVLNSGNIEIESGNIEIKTVGNNSIIAGMFSQSEEAQNAGSVTVNGGQINIEVENTNALSSDYYSIGIYSDKDVILQSGNVTVKATGAENINSYGIYCEKILKFNGGNHLIIANTSVVTCEPVVSELILINASFSVNGENKVQYESDKIFDYKYIEFNQVTENKLTLIVDNNFAEVGKSVQFSVSIDGKNIEQNKFSWEVLGATSLSTTIDENGYLTIGEDEKASSVTVVATAIDNSSVSKSFIVKINSNNNNNSLMWILFTVLGVFLIIVFVIIGFIINKRNSKIEKI